MSAPAAQSRRSQRLQGTIGASGRWMIYIVVVTALLWKGAAIPMAFFATCIAVGIAAILASLRTGSRPAIARWSAVSIAIAALLAVFAWLQSVTFVDNPLEHPIWKTAATLLAVEGGSIAVNPAMTREAILTLVAPFLVFSAVLLLFDEDASALRLMKVLALLGLAFAAFGVLQVSLLQDSLLFFSKVYYVDSLTSVFVNRNTAGTLLGVASFSMLIWFMSIFRNVPQIDTIPSDHVVRPDAVSRRTRLGLAASSTLFIVLCLFLTKSRGATLAAIAGYLVTLPMLFNEISRSLARRRDGLRLFTFSRALRAGAVAVGCIAIVIVLFGGLTSARIDEGGVDMDRLCVYRTSIRAFTEHWLLGTGFGDFQSVFPLYRTQDCGAVEKIFIRAHNFYLEGLSGFGILFLPVLVFAYVAILRILWIGHRTRRRYRFVPIAGLGAIVLVSVHGLVDFSLQIPGMAIYFAAFLAAVVAICLQRAETKTG